MVEKLFLLAVVIGCVAMNREGSAEDDGSWLRHARAISALHLAAAENRQDVLASLLQKGTDINARSPNGSTILHMAAARGDLDAVKFILENRINIGLPDNDGLTALHHAALNDHHDVMTVLLANGADVNARASDGSTLLHLAVANNMTGSVEFLLQPENILMSAKNNDLFTPLVLAERLGHLEIATLLRNAVGDISTDSLTVAIGKGSLEEVKSLVFRGADVNGINRDGWTPLQCAATFYADIVKFLVEHGAEVNTISYLNVQPRTTALYEAACWGNLGNVEYLVENGAEVNPIVHGVTPMTVANNRNHTDVVDYLRSKGGFII